MKTTILTPEAREAAERWYEKYYAVLCRDALARTGGDAFLADDLVQDTLLKGAQRYDQLRDRDRALPWLRAILPRVHSDWVARGRKTVHLPEEYDPEDAKTNEDAREEDWHPAGAVARLLRELPENHLRTLDALILGGLSQRRGAAILDIEETSFSMRMKRFQQWRSERSISEEEMFRAVAALSEFGLGTTFSRLCHVALMEARFDICVGSYVTGQMHRHGLRAEQCWEENIDRCCRATARGIDRFAVNQAQYLRRQRDRTWEERLRNPHFLLLCELKPEWAAAALVFAAGVADEVGAHAEKRLLAARCRELRAPSWDGLVLDDFLDFTAGAHLMLRLDNNPISPLFDALLRAYKAAELHDQHDRLLYEAIFGIGRKDERE
jgi:RNA polymerase sigma factor (sigma-70 family)